MRTAECDRDGSDQVVVDAGGGLRLEGIAEELPDLADRFVVRGGHRADLLVGINHAD
jgi:hypothetical protein